MGLPKSFSQIMTNPTRYCMTPNTQEMLLSSPVFLSNIPDRYPSAVSCNDLSGHCFTACVCNGCSVKWPVLISHRRLLKNFHEQAFIHDLASLNRYIISLIPSVEEAWTFFFNIFIGIVNKYAPIQKRTINNRFSPCLDRYLADLLHLKNCIWQKARPTHTQ